jgi:hypothetical protein
MGRAVPELLSATRTKPHGPRSVEARCRNGPAFFQMRWSGRSANRFPRFPHQGVASPSRLMHRKLSPSHPLCAAGIRVPMITGSLCPNGTPAACPTHRAMATPAPPTPKALLAADCDFRLIPWRFERLNWFAQSEWLPGPAYGGARWIASIEPWPFSSSERDLDSF